jgi:hypothetical protein
LPLANGAKTEGFWFFDPKNQRFSAIFRGQILGCGIFWAGNFFGGIDSKWVNNYLQGFWKYLYPGVV